MKACIGQYNPVIGDVAHNVQAMQAVIAHAKRQGAQLIVFPELAVSGYPPKDLLFCPGFVAECFAANDVLQAASDDNTVILWGNLARQSEPVGKPLFNAAYVAHRGLLIAQAHKMNLPMYDVFDEARYFAPGTRQDAAPRVTVFGKTMGVTVCEDLWSFPGLDSTKVQDLMATRYAQAPLADLQPGQCDLLINLSASPYVPGKPATRVQLLEQLAEMLQTTVIFANAVGAQDDVLFDGTSVITRGPHQTWQGASFQPEMACIDTKMDLEPPSAAAANPDWGAEIQAALCMGIRDYVQKTGFSHVYLGLSGGIDSALVVCLSQQALGAECVTAVAMPGPYSSSHSLEDAQDLARRLGIALAVYPITPLFESTLATLGQTECLADLAEQNLQARLRGMILMTLANRHNALVLATGNKSEIATGYSTLYGDGCGALAPIGDLYKTQVYALARFLNQQAGDGLIPERIFAKAPSAELAPGQTDAQALPPYDSLDMILQKLLEAEWTVGDCVAFGYDEDVVAQVMTWVTRSEYKRQQMPPVLKVSPKAFGSGRVYPIVHRRTPVPPVSRSQECPLFPW